VPLQKCPLDLWIYQEILTGLRPAVIVESGTAFGGSAHFLASLCELLGQGEVVSIDVEAYPDRPSHERLTYLEGSSTDPHIVAAVKEVVDARSPVLVILDSDHSKEHVLSELHTSTRRSSQPGATSLSRTPTSTDTRFFESSVPVRRRPSERFLPKAPSSRSTVPRRSTS
jgi:cephalosporin hydroxylase